MKEWTGIEIQHARQRLEQAAALVLGRMLFEFSRLDVALGLTLVWSGGGRRLDKLTKEVEELSFHKKLSFLEELVGAMYDGDHEARTFYDQWLADAHSIRLMRNELLHGRWGVEPIKDQVVNVVGLATSSNQRAKGYAISELERVLDQMERLQQRLSVLREDWPV